MSMPAAVAHLVDYEGRPDDVDARIGRADHAQVTTRDLFAPDVDIEDARQRWLFRMIHTRRPLQEKMALFWHTHFATAYSKLANDSGPVQAAKMLAQKPVSLRGPKGQLEIVRLYALGNFRDLVLFHEYFDGDTGRGVGASHQTGWSALIASLLTSTTSRSDTSRSQLASKRQPQHTGA